MVWNRVLDLNSSFLIPLSFVEQKELSLCHELWFSNPYTFGAHCRKPYIFLTMNSSRFKNLSKYIWSRKFELVGRTQLLCGIIFFFICKTWQAIERNWVIATNSSFQIHITQFVARIKNIANNFDLVYPYSVNLYSR